MNIERIDTYYDEFAEARPECVAKELGSRFVYIHRADVSKPLGITTQVKLKDPLQQGCTYVGYPPLENWLMNHFHPQIKMSTTKNQQHKTVILGSLELFDIPLASAPGLFDDPHCSMAEVYHCAAAFTYDMLYNGNGPELRRIDRLANRAACLNGGLSRLEEDASWIIDAYITKTYKSLVRMSQELTRYIRTKV